MKTRELKQKSGQENQGKIVNEKGGEKKEKKE